MRHQRLNIRVVSNVRKGLIQKFGSCVLIWEQVPAQPKSLRRCRCRLVIRISEGRKQLCTIFSISILPSTLGSLLCLTIFHLGWHCVFLRATFDPMLTHVNQSKASLMYYSNYVFVISPFGPCKFSKPPWDCCEARAWRRGIDPQGQFYIDKLHLGRCRCELRAGCWEWGTHGRQHDQPTNPRTNQMGMIGNALWTKGIQHKDQSMPISIEHESMDQSMERSMHSCASIGSLDHHRSVTDAGPETRGHN